MSTMLFDPTTLAHIVASHVLMGVKCDHDFRVELRSSRALAAVTSAVEDTGVLAFAQANAIAFTAAYSHHGDAAPVPVKVSQCVDLQLVLAIARGTAKHDTDLVIQNAALLRYNLDDCVTIGAMEFIVRVMSHLLIEIKNHQIRIA